MTSPQVLAELAELLEREIGLDATRVLPDVFDAGVRRRMQQAGVVDMSAYTSRLSGSREELAALVEEVAVPESSFFREALTLEALCQWALESAQLRRGRTLKVLTAGCSSGEEPYTMAMLLLAAGMSPEQMEIVGVDIRHRAIDAARRGEYGRRALRGKAVPKYLTASEDRLVVAPVVRQIVRFEVGNVLDHELLAGQRPFDIVLCRNLLMYMNAASQERVFRNMEHLLAEGGRFAVTAAEAPLLASAGFVRMESRSAAIFTRRPSAVPSAKAPPEPPVEVRPLAERTPTPVTAVPLTARAPAHPAPSPDSPAKARDDCWNDIGVWATGRPSCPRLAELHHCVNCPVYLGSGRGLLDGPAPAGYLAEWSASLTRAKEAEAVDTLAVTVFRLGEEWLAMPTRALAEVAELMPVRTLPHVSSPLLLGVVAIRGELHLCISLSNLLNVGSAGAKAGVERRVPPRLVVMAMNGERWVFPADEVAATVRVQPQSLKALPVTLAKDKSAYTVGLFQWEEQSVGLLDETLMFQSLRRGVASE